MTETKKWYAVYTRPRWEKKVSEIFNKQKVENYCPLNKIVRQWSDRKKVLFEPLFTSYVFVRAEEKDLAQIRKTAGVINFVYWLNKPAIICDHEIEGIRSFLKEHINVSLQKRPININDSVRVVGGPLVSMEGQVLYIKNKTVKLALPSLGYMMYTEIEKSNVEFIPAVTEIPNTSIYLLSAAK